MFTCFWNHKLLVFLLTTFTTLHWLGFEPLIASPLSSNCRRFKLYFYLMSYVLKKISSTKIRCKCSLSAMSIRLLILYLIVNPCKKTLGSIHDMSQLFVLLCERIIFVVFVVILVPKHQKQALYYSLKNSKHILKLNHRICDCE